MSQATQPVSTAAALRAGERRFARRGMWLMPLLGLLAGGGPALAHILGSGQAVLLTTVVFSGVFLAMLAVDEAQRRLAEQAQGLLQLTALHASAIVAVAPPAPRVHPAPPAPRIRARALASLTLTPRILAQRPISRRV